MARRKKPGGDRPAKSQPPKPGSDPQAARKIGGKGDFGVPVDHVADRDYVSANTKASDPGAAQPSSSEMDGNRVSGAGSKASGPGSGSGGDVDTDIVGVGTGGSTVSASGRIHEPPGPDDSDGTSREMASGPPARGENETGVGKVGGAEIVHGTTVDHSGEDAQTNPAGRGSDSANVPARQDDSFAGEVSSDEASGGEGG